MKWSYWEYVMLRHPNQLCKQGTLGKSDGQKGDYDCPWEVRKKMYLLWDVVACVYKLITKKAGWKDYHGFEASLFYIVGSELAMAREQSQ